MQKSESELAPFKPGIWLFCAFCQDRYYLADTRENMPEDSGVHKAHFYATTTVLTDALTDPELFEMEFYDSMQVEVVSRTYLVVDQ